MTRTFGVAAAFVLAVMSYGCAGTQKRVGDPVSECVKRCEQLAQGSEGRPEVRPDGKTVPYQYVGSCTQRCAAQHSRGKSPQTLTESPGPFVPPRNDP